PRGGGPPPPPGAGGGAPGARGLPAAGRPPPRTHGAVKTARPSRPAEDDLYDEADKAARPRRSPPAAPAPANAGFGSVLGLPMPAKVGLGLAAAAGVVLTALQAYQVIGRLAGAAGRPQAPLAARAAALPA